MLQFALRYPVRRCTGIELAKSRHNVAVAASEWISRSHEHIKKPGHDDFEHQEQEMNSPIFKSIQQPNFICGSFTEHIYNDATHVFANSLLFGPELELKVANVLAACPSLFQVVSTTALPMPLTHFKRKKECLYLPVSWQVCSNFFCDIRN